MIILKKNFKQGFAQLKISSSDDLWYLSHIISKNDKIKMSSERKIKINSGSDTNTKVVRKYFMLTLNIEDIEYNPSSHQLRVKGKIVDGPDDISFGSYHTFGLEHDSTFTLMKDSWPKYLQEKLLEATESKDDTILIVLFDRENSIYSVIKSTGIEHLTSLHADVPKKDMNSAIGKSNYELILEKILIYNKQYNPRNIVCASPSFWKKYLEEKIPAELKSKVIFVTCSEVHKRVVNEVMLRPELKQILESQRSSDELNLIEKILHLLQKEEIANGLNNVANAASQGAISEIAVTDKLILKLKEEDKYNQLDSLLKQIDETNGKIHFISSEDAEKTIDGLGGIVGILRWKLNQ